MKVFIFGYSNSTGSAIVYSEDKTEAVEFAKQAGWSLNNVL